MPIRRLTDQEYDTTFSLVIRVCVDAVIKIDGGVLMGLRDIEPCKNMWHFPGGMHYKNESMVDALKRIVKKETGLKIKPIEILGVMEFLNEIQNGKHRHTQSVVFLVESLGGNLRTDSQTSRFEIFKDIPKNIQPEHEKILRNNWQKIVYKYK